MGAQGCDRSIQDEVEWQLKYAMGRCVKAYERLLTAIDTKGPTSILTINNWKDDLRDMYELLRKGKQ